MRNLLRPAAFAVLVLVAGAVAGPGGNGKKDSQISLVRPADPPDHDAKGTLRIREKGNGERFDVHILKVTEGDLHRLWIEDPLDSDLFTDVGSFDSLGGSQKYKVDTKKDDALPLGAASIDDLIGRRVEVRRDAEVVLLGVVPPWDLSKKPQKAKISIEADGDAPAPDMHATLSLRSKADKGQERIDLKAKDVPWGDGLELRVDVENGVGSGVFVDAGKLEKTEKHAGRWRRDTKKGEALPDGVNFVSELAGRVIRVRRVSDDAIYLSATIPAVE